MKVSGSTIISRSAALRGKGEFDEAIKLIESHIDEIDDDIKLNAWLAAFRAAQEKGDQVQTRKFALLVATEDPDVPSIQGYL